MENNDVFDIFCTVVQMKEKEMRLYEKAASSCEDSVGVQTFGMLKDSEREQIARIAELQATLKSGGASLDACRLYVPKSVDHKAFMKRIAAGRKKLDKACVDDLTAIELALSLENEAIGYLNKEKERTGDPGVRDFLENLVSEERAHHAVLADLRFYYLDPEGWFLEKGRAVLDGA